MRIIHNNFTNLYINNQFIHSPVNPQKEALYFLRRRYTKKPIPRLAFIIAPGIGYITHSLQTHYPQCICINIFHDTISYNNALYHEHISWHPQQMQLEIIFNAIHPWLFSNYDIITWNPMLIQYHTHIAPLITKLTQLIIMHTNSLHTRHYFQTRWIRNICRMRYLRFIEAPCYTGIHLLLASGPQLMKYTNYIKHIQQYCHISVLPSSIAFALAHGIRIDTVFSSDGGAYAQEHLRLLTRIPYPTHIFLNAQAYPWYNHTQHTFTLIQNINDIQNFLFHTIPSIHVKQYPSVALTALATLQQLHTGTIILVGHDFAHYDILTHAQPHTRSITMRSQSQRLSTLTHLFWHAAYSYTKNSTQSHIKPWHQPPHLTNYSYAYKEFAPITSIYQLKTSTQFLDIQQISTDELTTISFMNTPRVQKKTQYYTISKKNIHEYKKQVQNELYALTIADIWAILQLDIPTQTQYARSISACLPIWLELYQKNETQDYIATHWKNIKQKLYNQLYYVTQA